MDVILTPLDYYIYGTINAEFAWCEEAVGAEHSDFLSLFNLQKH